MRYIHLVFFLDIKGLVFGKNILEGIMERKEILAKNIVKYSIHLKRGEKVWVEYSGVDDEMIRYLVREICASGGIPLLKSYSPAHIKYLINYGGLAAIKLLAKYDVEQMRDVDAVILLKGQENKYEYSDIDEHGRKLFDKYYSEPVHNKIRLFKKWVLLRYPTVGFAQDAHMSMESFEDLYYKVCLLDYSKMCKAMDGLKKLMEKTDKVHILSDETDLTFSIRGIPAVKCCGDKNIPDGEIYTAPVRDSINGHIYFNIPFSVNGEYFNGIRLEFRDGRVIDCDNPAFNKILDTDEGSRYVGEFAFGVNPYMTRPIGDILFDEKMAYSIHMALGNCYDDAPNGNHSAIHLDLICSAHPDFGGGKIFFDDKLIRENGIFTLDKLVVLNPDHLV